jgi:hypothetical protein
MAQSTTSTQGHILSMGVKEGEPEHCGLCYKRFLEKIWNHPMRKHPYGNFAVYNRYIAFAPDKKALSDKLVGLFAAGEARFLSSWIQWADADRTSK